MSLPAPAQKRWRIPAYMSDEVSTALGEYPPVLRQLLNNRGILDAEAAHLFLEQEGSLYDARLMLDMDIASERLAQAIEEGEPMAVYGDYDVDGVTATALLVQVLRALGGQARAYIPNRFDEGYGLNNEALDTLHAEGIRLVVTVDCGIRSPAEAEHARQLGMDLIITDHHEPKETLPQCLAVICPKRLGDPYPEKNLAGVGLAYKLAQAVAGRFERGEVNVDDWLDLVAVGTVADMVPLKGENRTLVRKGLKCLRLGSRLGLNSLAGVGGISNLTNLCARDIGFALGPRLNAAGRLESALAAYDLLMAENIDRAAVLSQNLDDQNRQRQEVTRQIQQQAEEIAGRETNPYLIFAAHPDFNQGVVGLAASKLTESYYRPAIIGYTGEEFTRASCRSIPEFHITKALDECSELLVRHGGHAAAAGFTVSNENLPTLITRMRAIAERELVAADLRPMLSADLVIALQNLRPELLSLIEQLEPCGQGNPEVRLVSRKLKVMRFRKIGNEGQHLRLTVSDGKVTYDAVAFRMGAKADLMPETVDMLYSFERNFYQGRESLQLRVIDFKSSGVPDM